ncbi:MAG: xanthine dehydrogenase family protein molybdopterin-binding subunit [SAR202 cluster bacterium]|nr:xanthine dehydrogenase family protein molybdopterin-binding subunit [SAR202 cluster bacterium]
MTTSYQTIGQPVSRAEGPDKVTGAALYTADLNLPGLLAGKCLRSPYPHARIKSIDASAARRLPGVRAVLTGQDIPENLVGRMLRDFPMLAKDVVRFVGQKVAAVAADDLDIAQHALNLIEVDYEELPAVFDPVEALEAYAPVLHPNFMKYAGRADDPQEHPNAMARATWGIGNVAEGFAQADYIFEHTFRTPHQHQGYIEPHAVIAQVDGQGRLQMWVNCKTPFLLRRQLSEGIGLPQDRIRINPINIGGDFGGKGSFMDSHVAYWLSKATGRPVRMVMNYIEELMAANPRHPAVMTFKTGVKRDGTITARHARLIFDSGAYGAFRPQKGITYGIGAIGPYRMEHSQIDSYLVYTNKVPCGNMRAPGAPQSTFASECQIDLIARELGMDPYQFRLHNLVRDGEESPLGHHWRNFMGKPTLDAAVREAGYQAPKMTPPDLAADGGDWKVGRGIAVCERHVGAGSSTAKISVDGQGQVTLYTPLQDTGAGFYTMLRQVVSEELGVPYNEVSLVPWSTDDARFDSGVGGSRVTHVGGQAVYGAARAVRAKLAALAADLYGWPESQVVFKESMVAAAGHQAVSLGALAARSGGLVEGDFTYDSERDEDLTCFTAQVAEVAVDRETGQVKVLNFTTAQDVGTVLNPQAHQGQIDGGVMQGLGYALLEELKHEDGRISTLTFGEYKMPTIADIPPLRTVLVQSQSGGPSPYGGKAIGEQPISAVAPAIANAVLDAVGASVTQLPITAERVLQALRSQPA